MGDHNRAFCAADASGSSSCREARIGVRLALIPSDAVESVIIAAIELD
jgi:hypothetical protein